MATEACDRPECLQCYPNPEPKFEFKLELTARQIDLVNELLEDGLDLNENYAEVFFLTGVIRRDNTNA